MKKTLLLLTAALCLLTAAACADTWAGSVIAAESVMAEEVRFDV